MISPMRSRLRRKRSMSGWMSTLRSSIMYWLISDDCRAKSIISIAGCRLFESVGYADQAAHTLCRDGEGGVVAAVKQVFGTGEYPEAVVDVVVGRYSEVGDHSEIDFGALRRPSR